MRSARRWMMRFWARPACTRGDGPRSRNKAQPRRREVSVHDSIGLARRAIRRSGAIAPLECEPARRQALREWMGSGGPRGLQILPSGANPTRGGFDSHTFPPTARRAAPGLVLAAALLAAALLAAAPLAAAAEPAGVDEAPARRRPSPTRATLESLAFPGLGQLRSGDTVRGLLILGLESYLVTRVVIEDKRSRRDLERSEETTGDESDYWRGTSAHHRDRRNDLLFWTAISHMYNLLDAYVSAHLAGVEEEIDRVQRITWRIEPTADGGGDVSLSWAF